MSRATLSEQWQSTFEELDVPQHTRRILVATMIRLEDYHLPTAEHCKRVGVLAVRIGQHRGLPLKPLFYGASLHDRGKLNVTRELLDKTEEWTEADAIALRDHPSDGYDVTVGEGMIVTAGLVVRHHTYQPNSYPEPLPEAPPFMTPTFETCARTIALADFFDAAHRADSDGLSSEAEIRAKMLAHNPDVTTLIDDLYANDILR